MIPENTPYKVLKYLINFFSEKIQPMKYESDPFMLYLLERGFLIRLRENPTKFCTTHLFEELFAKEIILLFQKFNSFIKKYQIENLENYYSVQEFEALIKIENDRVDILSGEHSFQVILTKYFGSSKHRKADSILSEAIKKILGVVYFPEENKDQQFLSILYPINESRFIILCENKNRLIISRHDFIEFWYVGGKNIKQLQFVPKPILPIFYLCDWDFDGLNIYTEIKRKYFPTISAIIPDNFKFLMEQQEEV